MRTSLKLQSIWLSILLAVLVTYAVYGAYNNTTKSVIPDFNLGFETVSNPDRLPDEWFR